MQTMRSRRLLAGVLLVTAHVAVLAPGDGAAASELFSRTIVTSAGNTSWITATSEHNSWIHGGQASTYMEPEWRLGVAQGFDDDLHVNVVDPEDGSAVLAFIFQPAPGSTLTEGHYPNALGSRETGRPGMDVLSPGHGCNQSHGSFTVHELAPDLSRLWISYDFRCGPDYIDGEAVVGEIRLNEPAQPRYSVAPTSMVWPEESIGEPGRLAPVTVLNPGPEPLRVASVEVTAGAEEFAVVHDSCGTLDPGGFCRIHVQATPRGLGPRTGALTIATDHGDRNVPLYIDGLPGSGESPPPPAVRTHAEQAPAAAPRRTRWTMEADPDAWVGNPGGSHSFDAADVDI